MTVGKDDKDELNFKGNNRMKLVQLGRDYSKSGYFVFLVDNRSGNFKEIRYNEVVLDEEDVV